MSLYEKNIEREAHIAYLCLNNEVDWQWRGRHGRAQYAHPRKGESAVVHLPQIRGQMTYFVALHELGHVLSSGNRYLRTLESEADAWQWALANTEEEPTKATLKGIRRRLSSYVAKAIRSPRMHLPDEDSDFERFWRWLSEAARDY